MIAPLPPDAAVPQPAEGRPPSAFNVLGWVFIAPRAAFEAIAKWPRWLWPLVVVFVMSLVVQQVIVSRMDWDATIHQSMSERAGGQNMSAEQLDRAVQGAKTFSKFTVILTALSIPLIYLLVGGVYFLGVRTLGSDAEFKPVFATVLHAGLPGAVLSQALLGLVAWQRSSFAAQEIPRMLKSSVAAWLPASAPKMLIALGGVLDLFNVWQWVLLALGLSIVGKLPRAKVVGLIAVVWGIWTLAKIGLAALGTVF